MNYYSHNCSDRYFDWDENSLSYKQRVMITLMYQAGAWCLTAKTGIIMQAYLTFNDLGEGVNRVLK